MKVPALGNPFLATDFLRTLIHDLQKPLSEESLVQQPSAMHTKRDEHHEGTDLGDGGARPATGTQQTSQVPRAFLMLTSVEARLSPSP